MKHSFDNLETEIVNLLTESLNYLHTNEICGDKNWTLKFKESLAQLGESKGYKICTSGFQDMYNSEWLFDMVWYIEDEAKRLIDVPLVVESEWGSNQSQIKFDFEKLLLANSTSKLMICQSYAHNYDTLINYFDSAIQSYNLNKTGDRYLIAVLDIKLEVFNFQVLVKG